MKHTKNRKLLLYITVGAIFLLVFLRFGLFFLKSEGFSGLSVGRWASSSAWGGMMKSF